MRNFETLDAWKLAMEVADDCLDLADAMTGPSRFVMGDQVRRAAISIPSNLAEGAGRESASDFARFVGYAMSSLYELQTQLNLSRRRGLVPPDDNLEQPLRRLRGMLYSLTLALKGRS